jgi:hypothetical protein
MRVHTSKLNRHKHDPVQTRPFKRELQRVINNELRGFNEPATRRFMPYVREFLKGRFTK